MNQQFRLAFPALIRMVDGQQLVFMDGPGGTQVPEAVIKSMADYYRNSNANTHGAFVTAKETDTLIAATREACSTFLGAEGPHTISFGQNMTSLNFALSNAMAGYFQPGDEVLITQLDHEANRGPWLELRKHGIQVREVRLLPDGTLDYEDMANKITERTRLLAMGLASNLNGTVNNVKLARKLTYEVGAWLLLDAVHYAPHFPIDVLNIGCDFLLCSAYKFYGPHVGILYSRPGTLDRLATQRLRTAPQAAPESIETGTLNHAALAGVKAAIDFLAAQSIGNSYRHRLLGAMERIHLHESRLARTLAHGLGEMKGVNIIGLNFGGSNRTPTLALTVDGQRPATVCAKLAAQQILAWDGHFYAKRAVEVLGLLEKGGVTRLGLSAYSSEEDVNRVINAFKQLIN